MRSLRRPKKQPSRSLARQGSGPDKRGGLLIAVIVLLMVAGLLVSQSAECLLLISRGNVQRRELHQARELAELGWVLRRQVPDGRRRRFEIELDGSRTGYIDMDQTVPGRTRWQAGLVDSTMVVSEETPR